MLIRKALLTVVALGAFTAASAQQGYFDFGQIPGVAAEPNVQVDLGPALLTFAAEAARQSDPRAADMIAGLQGIRVRVYEQIEDSAAVSAFVEETSSVLERTGWERVVFVQDGQDKVRVYARTEGSAIEGMTVLVLDATDAVFINIAGRIDPTQLGRVAAAMGLGGILGGFMGGAPVPAN
jgi:hypothetical protein